MSWWNVVDVVSFTSNVFNKFAHSINFSGNIYCGSRFHIKKVVIIKRTEDTNGTNNYCKTDNIITKRQICNMPQNTVRRLIIEQCEPHKIRKSPVKLGWSGSVSSSCSISFKVRASDETYHGVTLINCTIKLELLSIWAII